MENIPGMPRIIDNHNRARQDTFFAESDRLVRRQESHDQVYRGKGFAFFQDKNVRVHTETNC